VYDTIVVGGGVAGLTAGLFTARRGLSTLVLVSAIPGGQLATIDRVDDFPGFPSGIPGYELGPAIQEQAMLAGAELSSAEAHTLGRDADGWHLGTVEGDLDARTVIIASGSRPRELGVPGEERLRGRGVSHCASCDGPLLVDRPVVVVGAGDSGLQEALTLAGFAKDVLVVHRGPEPVAQAALRVAAAANSRIRFRPRSTLDEILGDERVTAVRLRDTERGAVEEVEAAAVFVYIGLEPNTEWLRGALDLDENGRIPTDAWMRTAQPGLFAAGDLRTDSAGAAITAAGDAATAAIAASRYLSDNASARNR
jgi:thioredoxin reductase (NADPH)